MKLRQLKGIVVDENLMKSRMKRDQAENVGTLSMTEAKEQVEKVKED